MTAEYFHGLAGDMSYQNPAAWKSNRSSLNQTYGSGNSFNSDEDTDDLVGASVKFALRRASEAAVWYRQKSVENGGQCVGTAGACQQPYFHTITPSNLENTSPLQTRFDPLPLSTSDMRRQSTSSSFSSSSPQNSSQERSQSRSEQDRTLEHSTSNSSEDHAIPRARKAKRPKSDTVDPNSARAIYLEKNRQAASRCRRNQKRKTDSLVEKARVMEEKNKILKVEVAYLKEDMASLMDVVASHSHCSDHRLRTYVQREADRLADGRRANLGEPITRSTPSPANASSPSSGIGDAFPI